MKVFSYHTPRYNPGRPQQEQDILSYQSNVRDTIGGVHFIQSYITVSVREKQLDDIIIKQNSHLWRLQIKHIPPFCVDSGTRVLNISKTNRPNSICVVSSFRHRETIPSSLRKANRTLLINTLHIYKYNSLLTYSNFTACRYFQYSRITASSTFTELSTKCSP